MKFGILTDTHFVARGRKIYGLDPAGRLTVAVDRINRDHPPDISFVIVTGDLAHWGEDRRLTISLRFSPRLNAPTILLMGNHDKRDPFGRYFHGRRPRIRHRLRAGRAFVRRGNGGHARYAERGRPRSCRAAVRSAGWPFSNTRWPRRRRIVPFATVPHHPPFDTGLRYMETASSSPIPKPNGMSSRARESRTICSWAICTGRFQASGAASPSTSSAHWRIKWRSTSKPWITFPARMRRRTIHVTVDARGGRDPSVLVPLRRTAVLAAGPRRAGVDRPVISDRSR